MAPLRYAAKFDPILSLDCAGLRAGIKGKEGIKFCHLSTLPRETGSTAAGTLLQQLADYAEEEARPGGLRYYCTPVNPEFPGSDPAAPGFLVHLHGHGGGDDGGEEPPPKEAWLPDGYSKIFRSYEFGPSGFGLWLRYATLQNLILSFPWIAPPRLPPRRNPRKGRDQILPSGNLARRWWKLAPRQRRWRGRGRATNRCAVGSAISFNAQPRVESLAPFHFLFL